MHIAYVCADPGVPVFGRKGASVHVREVIAALRRAGAEVDLFAARLGGATPTPLRDVRVHRITTPSGVQPADRESALLAVNAAVRADLRRRGPFDLVYERHALWAFGGMEHARATGVPGLLEVNSPLVDEQANHRTLIDRTGAEVAADRAFIAASRIIAVSRGVADHAEQRSGGRTPVTVIPNGVDPARFSPRRSRRLTDDAERRPFTVGFLGTLKPWHDLGTLMRAVARLRRRRPSARLVVVGEGPGGDALERDAARLGLTDALDARGAVDPFEVPEILAGMDVAVAPYPDLRPFYFSPLKLVEYMAAGLPVVASAVGEIDDLVEDGVTGLLYPPGDAAALETTLERLAADPLLGRRLGRAGRDRVTRERTWDEVVRQVLAMPEVKRHSADTAGVHL